jgi:DNA mismatch repair ATPase MutL
MKKEKKVSHVQVCSILPDIFIPHIGAAIRRSPRKIEKKPIYVINVFIAPEDVDNYIEPTKNAVHLRVSTSPETHYLFKET